MNREAPRPSRARPSALPALGIGLAIAAVALASCGEVPDAHDDARCLAAINDPESINAFEWFKGPYGGPKIVGGWSTDEGLAFAHQLEAKGAKRVVAVGIHRVTQPDHPHQSADALVVELPDDPRQRLALFKLYAMMVRRDGVIPLGDDGQKYVYLPSPH